MAECVICAKSLLRRLKNIGTKNCIETPQVIKMQNDNQYTYLELICDKLYLIIITKEQNVGIIKMEIYRN